MAYSSNKNKKVNTRYLQEVADNYRKNKSTSSTVDIVSFVEAKWGLNINLFPVQKFILKSYYGMELDKTDKTIIIPDEINNSIVGKFTEEEFMKFLIDTGRTNLQKYEPCPDRRELVLCVGRRGSKSAITSFIALYEMYRLIKMGNPQKYFGFPDGSEISVCTTAPSIEASTTLFQTLKNYCMNSNFLNNRVVASSRTSFSIATDRDIEKESEATLKLVCAGAASNDIRGRSNIVIIMDEAAFFQTSGDSNGNEVYKALKPSTLSFTHELEDGRRQGEGKQIMISSPFGKSGVFYEHYLESFKSPDEVLMFNMYTSMINPNVDSADLRKEKRMDPAMFDCEYCAKFSDTVSSWIDGETLSKVVDTNRTVNPKSGIGGIEYYMGIDYAGKTDGAAISIVHREGEKIVLDYSDVYYGGQSDVWNDMYNKIYGKANKLFSGFDIIPLEGFADEIKRLNDLFPIRHGIFDQFNGYALVEMLRNRGLNQFDMKSLSSGLNMQMYQICKELINSGLVSLPNHPILVPEILSLEETKNGSRISVQAPRRAGCHDDITDSFCWAVMLCYEKMQDGKTNAKSIVSGNGYSGGISLGSRGYNAYHLKKMKNHGYNDKMFGGLM